MINQERIKTEIHFLEVKLSKKKSRSKPIRKCLREIEVENFLFF